MLPLPKPWQFGHCRAGGKAYGAGRQRLARRPTKPGLGRNIERRLCACAVAIGPRSRPQLAQAQPGVSRRGMSSPSSTAGPEAATLRSTALISPAKGASFRVRARSTAVPTAACGGASRKSERRGAEPENMPHRQRRFAAQMRLQHRVQRAGMAQHRSRQPVRRRLVARRHRRQRVEGHVQRRISGQNRLQ